MDVRGTDFVYYQTGDIDRTIAFYRDTLGLEMYGYYEEVKWAEFNAGLSLRLHHRSGWQHDLDPLPQRRNLRRLTSTSTGNNTCAEGTD